ncbi:MAG: hypothetical protein ACHQRM_04955 [Bacteroidia bacterium]
MNMKAFILLLFTLPTTSLHAQDTIALKIGVKIPAQIKRENDTIFFRPWGSTDTNAISRLMLYQISYIRYQNGTVKSFESSVKANTMQVLVKVGLSSANELGLGNFTAMQTGYDFTMGFVGKLTGKKKRIRYEAEVGSIQKGGYVACRYNVLSVPPGPLVIEYPDDNIKLNYLTALVSIRYYLAPDFYVKTGLNACYLTGFTTEYPDVYHAADLWNYSAGIQGGLGWMSKGKKAGFLIELLAQNDFTDLGLVGAEKGTHYHNSCILVNIGVWFNWDKK